MPVARRTPPKSAFRMCVSIVRAIMSGPSSAATDDTTTAMKAIETLFRSGRISGSRRASDAATPGWRAKDGALLSAYEFVVAGAALGIINLCVLGRGLQQIGVPAGGQDFAFHEENDLLVILHRFDLLRHREQRDIRIVAAHVIENRTRRGRVDTRDEVVEQEDARI